MKFSDTPYLKINVFPLIPFDIHVVLVTNLVHGYKYISLCLYKLKDKKNRGEFVKYIDGTKF